MTAEDRAAAVQALEHMVVASDTTREISYASEATARALLYIGDQLRDLVEAQRAANTIAAYDPGRALDTPEEFAAGRRAVRAALGLAPEGQ